MSSNHQSISTGSTSNERREGDVLKKTVRKGEVCKEARIGNLTTTLKLNKLTDQTVGGLVEEVNIDESRATVGREPTHKCTPLTSNGTKNGTSNNASNNTNVCEKLSGCSTASNNESSAKPLDATLAAFKNKDVVPPSQQTAAQPVLVYPNLPGQTISGGGISSQTNTFTLQEQQQSNTPSEFWGGGINPNLIPGGNTVASLNLATAASLNLALLDQRDTVSLQMEDRIRQMRMQQLNLGYALEGLGGIKPWEGIGKIGPMMPGQMMPGQMMPGQMMPGQMMPGQMMPGQVMPGQVMPGQVMPGQVMPGQVMPGQVMPGQMMPGQAMPGQAMPGQAMPGQVMPGQMMPGQMMPGQVMPGQVMPGQMGMPGIPVLDQRHIELDPLSRMTLMSPPETGNEIGCGGTRLGPNSSLSEDKMLMPVNCKRKMNPSQRWSYEEDNTLRRAVRLEGTNKFDLISSTYFSGSRSEEQCEKRWLKVLQPGLVKGPWRPAEDKIIVDCIANGVTKWAEIAKRIPGRIGKQVSRLKGIKRGRGERGEGR